MDYQTKVKQLFLDSGMIFTDEELETIEFVDFGLGAIEVEGLNLFVYENNERYCGKELALLPYQTCPEHRHPPRKNDLGKRETFRCRKGIVYLYVEGEEPEVLSCELPENNQATYTVRKEIVLRPGDQYTIEPNIKHWFQAGETGALVTEFSSSSDDASDIFTNPMIQR